MAERAVVVERGWSVHDLLRAIRRMGGAVVPIGATVIAGAVIAGAIFRPDLPIPGGGTPPPADSANLWVDTNGGTCTRQASPATYTDATACSSIDAAFDAASCGDTVLIKAGSYSSQTVTGTKACSATWTMGASRGVTCTSCVTMRVANGATATFGGLTTNGVSYFALERGAGADLNIGGWGIPSTASNNLIVRDADVSGDVFLNTNAGTGPFSNIALVGGSVGGFDLVPGTFLAVYLQTCGSCGPNATLATNILIDGVDFHDLDTPNTGDHTGVIRVDGGYNGVTIRNSTFVTNLNVTTSAVQTTNIGTGGIDPINFSLVNNYFGSQGTSLRSMNFNSALSNCTNYRILYNTSTIPLYLFGCPSETGTVTAGNAAPWPVGADCFGTHLKNYWSGANSGCGTDQWTSGSLGLSNFVPQPGSVLLQAGETANCPATDHDGNTRPNPVATNCDVGAYESTS